MQTKWLLLTALVVLAGCAARQAFNEGRSLIDAGRVEEGLAKIDEASKIEPGSHEFRQQFFLQRDAALQRFLALAEGARQQSQWDVAEAAYRRMLGIDPQNQRARAGLESLRAEQRHRTALFEAEALFKGGKPDEALLRARQVLAENANNREAQLLLRRIENRAVGAATGPQLTGALKQSVSLEFRDQPLRTVLEIISKAAGINFMFDRDVRPDLRTTIFVRDTAVDDVIRFLLVTNQLERKMLSENTVLVYPNVVAKAREYQDLLVKTFYLANADVKVTANLIRTLVKTKDLHIDEKLNLIVMRDTPAAVRMAERLVASQDLAEPEVMLEVEVLEVGSSVLSELGLRWPDQVSYSLIGAAGAGGQLALQEWLNRSSGLVRMTVTNPFFVLSLRNQAGASNLLANPRIRVKNKDKAKVHIGDKVPVITTTSTATGFVSESVNYLDVGLKLEVEPTIFLEDEVGIKVGLEVSNIVREIRSTAGTLTYQVGTRNASTALRLKDGETQVLAGLISDEDRRTVNRIPGIGDLPVVGRLFGNHGTNASKTEIVLLITPRIVRSLARPELRFEEFPAGTEAAIGAPPLLLRNIAPAAEAAGAGAAPERAPLASAAATAVKLGLQAPAEAAAGVDFTVRVTLDTARALRKGSIDIAFDPSRLRFVRAQPGSLLAQAGPGTSFQASAPEGLGRLTLSHSGDMRGAGELATLTFQLIGPAVGAPSIRVEAASATDAAGRALTAQLPPPVAVSFRR